jgi:hypothetical protein
MYVSNLEVSFLNTSREIYNFIYKLTLALFCIVNCRKNNACSFRGLIFENALSLFALSLQRI